jgi:hypothetical protein
MTADMENDEEPPLEVPRAVQIAAGIFLFLLAALALAGSLALVVMPPPRNPPLAVLAGGVSMLGSLWVLSASVRLVTGRRRRTGGLLSPFALRVTGVLFAVIPVAAFFTDAYRDSRYGSLRVAQAISYLTITAALFRLASRRASDRRLAGRQRSWTNHDRRRSALTPIFQALLVTAAALLLAVWMVLHNVPSWTLHLHDTYVVLTALPASVVFIIVLVAGYGLIAQRANHWNALFLAGCYCGVSYSLLVLGLWHLLPAYPQALWLVLDTGVDTSPPGDVRLQWFLPALFLIALVTVVAGMSLVLLRSGQNVHEPLDRV